MFDERQVPEAMREKLWKVYYDKLSKGIDIGYAPELEQYNPQLAHALKYNIAEFSAFKETAFKNELQNALTKNGAIVPWSDFKKEALRVSGLYNVNYLQTEYHQTVATANMAGKWQDFQQNKDLYPNLRYDAINDERTRQKHKDWDGFIAPLNHPIWKTMYPPNDWGCRCDVIQTDEPVSKELPEANIKETFKNNAAISGKVFNDVPYAAGLSAKEIKDSLKQANRNFEKAEYKPFKIPFKGKGTIMSSNLVNTNSSDYKDVLACCMHFAESKSVTEVLPKLDATLKNSLYKKIYKDLENTSYWGKCPDFRVGSIFYEFEGFVGDGKNKASKMMTRGLKQASRIVIKHDGSTLNHYKKLINFRIKEGQKIDEVWIYFDENRIDRIQ